MYTHVTCFASPSNRFKYNVIIYNGITQENKWKWVTDVMQS